MTRNLLQISDEEARRLWQRAVELQEESERSAAARSLASNVDETRLSLAHVLQAAEGAGIPQEFVLTAMAERLLPDAAEIRRDRLRARWLRGAVSTTDAIEASKLIRAPLSAVVAAVQTVASQPAFNMLLENVVGGEEPLQGRVLVCRLQGGTSQFNHVLNLADVRVLLVAVRSVQDGTSLRVRAPLFRRGINLGVAGITATLGGVGGSWSGYTLAALAAGALGGAAGSLLLIPAGLGALAGGALGLGGFRALYQKLVNDGSGAIGTFLTSVALEAESSTGALSP